MWMVIDIRRQILFYLLWFISVHLFSSQALPWRKGRLPLHPPFDPHGSQINQEKLQTKSENVADKKDWEETLVKPVPRNHFLNESEPIWMSTTIGLNRESESIRRYRMKNVGILRPFLPLNPVKGIERNVSSIAIHYNPLPYGRPGTFQLEKPIHDQEASSKKGLPFARRPTQRESLRPPLRLPIPDSELYYRRPLNASLFREKAIHHQGSENNFILANTTQSPFVHHIHPTSIDSLQSFRVLMGVLKSLMANSERS